MTDDSANAAHYIALASDIVSAYVSKNAVPVSELPGVISAVHAALSGLANAKAAEKPAEPLTPAVPVKKSVSADYIICLEDGKKFKSLKRHLRTRYNMTPDEYRTRWGLPSDYPMVAPSYAAARSELAKSMGLGAQRRKGAQAKAAAPDPVVTDQVSAKAKRARKPKAA
jgi:predicted transcriptional regulator